jgi:hypothetical protein
MVDASKYASINSKTFAKIGHSLTTGRFTFTQMKTKINSDNPFIAIAGYYDGSTRNGGHAVVIYGWNDDKVRYVDPANGASVHTTCTYTAFCNGTYNTRKYDGTVYGN